MKDFLITIFAAICGTIAYFLTGHYLVNLDNATFREDLKDSLIFGGMAFGILFVLRKVSKKIIKKLN
ncbi:MAG: hypothetical protein HZB41_05695 [Ignavibacteriae bacterium]|nr:hypothetical protein [Ignavibacteriota bacterium]